MRTEVLARYADAERSTASWARSFHFASRFLPREKRLAICALYDYCRWVDNLVDARGGRPVAAVRADLATLGEEVRRMHAGALPRDPRWLAFHDTLQRFPVPAEPLLELIDGVAMDLGPVRMADFPALREYCRLVAGGVGLMLGPILGAPPERFTRPGLGLGIAMQLTNVLRDVGEDLGHDRIYLPADELAAFGVTEALLHRRTVTPAFERLMRFQVARARQYFDAGDVAVAQFPGDGSRLTARLMQRIYAGILDQIERQGYDVFTRRAWVPTHRKFAILGGALVREFLPPALGPARWAA